MTRKMRFSRVGRTATWSWYFAPLKTSVADWQGLLSVFRSCATWEGSGREGNSRGNPCGEGKETPLGSGGGRRGIELGCLGVEATADWKTFKNCTKLSMAFHSLLLVKCMQSGRRIHFSIISWIFWRLPGIMSKQFHLVRYTPHDYSHAWSPLDLRLLPNIKSNYKIRE